MKKVVFDTNVWISAICFHGRVRSLLNPDHDGKFEVSVSPAILEETVRILQGPKFRYSPEAVAVVEYAIRKLALVVRPTEQLEVVKADLDDDRVLECAVESAAEIIVSGDNHLLDIGTYRSIRILDPATFLKELEGESNLPTAQEPPAVYRIRKAKPGTGKKQVHPKKTPKTKQKK